MYILSILLFINIFLLNTSNKLMICAALFIGSTLAVNSIVEFYGKRKAIISLIICTVLASTLKWQSFTLMILISYIAILASLFSSIMIFEKLKSRFNFHISNYISLIVASIVDSAVVCVGLLYKLSMGKCLSIYTGDLIFKFSYSSILGVSLLIIVYVFNALRDYRTKKRSAHYF